MRIKRIAICVLMILGAVLVVATRAERSMKPYEDDIAARIDGLLSGAYESHAPGAAVLVVRRGEVIFRKGYGMADMELGVPVSPDMIFGVGSVTKMFTAAAAMLLAETGRLDYSDPISRYLEVPSVHWDGITVHHLLSHTSGIVDLFQIPAWMSVWKEDVSPRDLVGFFRDKPLDFTPGSEASYSNSNYILLGQIVEKISGKPLGEFVKGHILDPLELENTYFSIRNDDFIEKRVKGCLIYPDGSLRQPPYISLSHAYAVGSAYCSVDDLAKFVAALAGGKVVGRETIQKAFTPQRLDDGTISPYGYGNLFVLVENSDPMIRISGSSIGYEVYSIYLQREDIYVALFSCVSAYPGVENPYRPGPMVTKIIELLRPEDRVDME